MKQRVETYAIAQEKSRVDVSPNSIKMSKTREQKIKTENFQCDLKEKPKEMKPCKERAKFARRWRYGSKSKRFYLEGIIEEVRTYT